MSHFDKTSLKSLPESVFCPRQTPDSKLSSNANRRELVRREFNEIMSAAVCAILYAPGTSGRTLVRGQESNDFRRRPL